MAEPRETFPVLQDVAGGGVALTKVNEGDTSVGINGAPVFAFRDAAGNETQPQLDAMGRLPVTTEPISSQPRAAATVGGASGMTLVASIPVTANKSVAEFQAQVSCRRDAYAELRYEDAGPSSVVLSQAILGPGQYTSELGIDQDAFAVPASAGSPVLAVYMKNYDTLSDLHAAVRANVLL